MSRRATLSAQLAQLTSSAPSFDPDSADNLDGRVGGDDVDNAEEEAQKRKHYVDVGPSRLRGQMGMMGGQEGRYGGEVRGRVKIFDDDDDQSEEGGEGEDGEGESGSEDDDEEDGEDEDGEEDEEMDEEEISDDEEEEGDEDDGDEEGDEDDEEGEEEDQSMMPVATSSSKSLDPISALRDSRQKDIVKGQAIRRQQTLFETLLTIRITYQKALTALSKLPAQPPSDASDEIKTSRSDVLSSLAELSEGLFQMMEGITLPGMEVEALGLGKRKRGGEDVEGVGYWVGVAEDSLVLNDAMRENSLPILNKWSTKIQAATLSIGGKAAGSSKFLAGTKSQMGVVEAIESGLANRRNPGPVSPLTLEETHYRSLLREIIDSRTSNSKNSTHMTDTSYRLEKKKKRDAERGNSKGRKIRYTIHEKATNFAVPMEIFGGWGESQTDELFGSLLGGVGMKGGRSEGGGGAGLEGMGSGLGAEESELSGLGGLRVF